MEPSKYIDIHTHTFAPDRETTLLLNVYPGEKEKLEYPVYKSIGLHPWHVQEETWPPAKDAIENSMKIDSVIALGETGLDKTIKTDFTRGKYQFRSSCRFLLFKVQH